MKRLVVFGGTALTAAALMFIGQAATHVFAGPGGSVSNLADCQQTDTPGDASLNCAPAVVPDDSDQLTEQEVAEPGFNGSNHSGGGGGGGGHH